MQHRVDQNCWQAVPTPTLRDPSIVLSTCTPFNEIPRRMNVSTKQPPTDQFGIAGHDDVHHEQDDNARHKQGV